MLSGRGEWDQINRERERESEWVKRGKSLI